MTLAFGIAIYLLIWWVLLFAMLPIGVRTQSDEGEVTPGTAESAPLAPRLLLKMLATTVISGIVFAAVYAVMELHVISLDDIPFFPRYETIR
jgi:predicted secreted protein